MTLSLELIASNPSVATYDITLRDGERVIFRPLTTEDVKELTSFLENLSPTTRVRSIFDSYDEEMAQELCDAINRYDKLRFVLEVGKDSDAPRIVGLIEFGFGLPQGDIERYQKEGIALNEDTDCRFGPTISDEYQGKGLGGKVFPLVVRITQEFGKKRILLWGGVRKDNEPAIRYYEKNGFHHAGEFKGQDGTDNLDMIVSV